MVGLPACGPAATPLWMTEKPPRSRFPAAKIVAAPSSFPESAIIRIREIASSHPGIEMEIGGGLAEGLRTCPERRSRT